LAIRLIAEINKVFEVSLPVPAFFLNPTMEGIARFLDRENPKPRPEIVPLQSGSSSRALFFIDATLGMSRLASLLTLDAASFATSVPIPPEIYKTAIDNRPGDLPPLADLAAPHVALIRDLRPQGQCVLIGYSFGGLLAFEVAHQLRREGQRVDAVILLDTAVLTHWWLRLKKLTFRRALTALSFRIERLRTVVAQRNLWNRRHKLEFATRNAQFEQLAAEQFVEVPWEIRQKFYAPTYKTYRPRPLDSYGVLIRAQASPNHSHHADMGWSGLFTEGLEIVDVPGAHGSMLTTHIFELSQALQKCLFRK
jgi:thioesterase domain-containing protein